VLVTYWLVIKMFKLKSTYSQLSLMFVFLLLLNFIVVLIALRQFTIVPTANQIANLINNQIKSIELLAKGKSIEHAQIEINNAFPNSEINLNLLPEGVNFPNLTFYNVLKNKIIQANNAQVKLQTMVNKSIIWTKPYWSQDYWIGIEFQPFIQKIINLIALIFSSLLILSFVAAYVFSRYMLRPFKNLANMATEIIEQKSNAKDIEIKGTQEVKEIAQLVKSSANQIQQLNNDKEMFLAGVSHDLRTPLARMQLQAEFINDEETRIALIQEIQEMDSIIGDFVTYVRSGTLEESNDHDIVSIISESITQFSQMGHSINFLAPESPITIKIKPISVKRMLTNIYENAFKYGKAPVIVNIIEDKKQVKVCIIDSGEGIKESDLDAIFKPFVIAQNLDNTFGSGLGLSIVKKLAQQNNAKVIARNHEPKGLEVCIIFIQT